MIQFLLDLPRPLKRVVQMLADALILTVCFALAIWLRTDTLYLLRIPSTWVVLLPVIPVSLLIFVHSGLYRAVVRYMGRSAAGVVLVGVVASAVTLAVSNWL